MLSYIKKKSPLGSLILLMFSIVCLLNVGYTILRSARNALAVVDLGSGASSIPWFELCGTMPGAMVMTLVLTYLLNRFSIQKVFFLTLLFFVSFFLIFSLGIYPIIPNLQLAFCQYKFSAYIPFFASMLFFVMAELWKVALLTVLFWGFLNRFFPIDSAKKYYAPLASGGSLGAVIAGPIISFCTSDLISGQSWEKSLTVLMLMLTFVSLLTALFFSLLARRLGSDNQLDEQVQQSPKKESFVSIFKTLTMSLKSKPLLLLAWITIADYIAYGLGEVIFLDILTKKYPDPRQYCDFMGYLSVANGLLTAVSAFLLTPYVLKRFKWVVASLITPVCLLFTQGVFFIAIWFLDLSVYLDVIIVSGCIFFAIVRAVKYTFFDTSKEIFFLMLPRDLRMQGKLVVDGLCSRFGRGGSSFLSIALIQVFGSVLATSTFSGIVALIVSFSCLLATTSLGFLVEKSQSEQDLLKTST